MGLFLCLQGNTYHYRKAVPTLLRPYLGKREIKKSLCTGNKLEANRKSLLLGSYIEEALILTKSIIMSKALPEDEIQNLLRDYFHFLLRSESLNHDLQFSFADLVRSKRSKTEQTDEIDLSDWDGILKSLENTSTPQISNLEKALSNHRLESEAILQKLKNEHTSISYETVRADLTTRYPQIPLTGGTLNRFSLTGIEAQKLIFERRCGNNPPIPNQYSGPQGEDLPPAQAQPVTVPSIPLTQVIAEYTKDRLATDRWTDKTKQENHALYQNFLDFIEEEVTCATIDYHLVSRFRDALKQLPANRNKSKKYRNKTIKQLLEMDIKKTMSTTTINKNLNRLSTLFNFAIKLGYMSTNPAMGMEIPVNEKDSEQRDVFTREDLQKLFDSSQYKQDNFAQPYMFWACPIALFTGMRQTEIAQLHLSDIREDNGIWIIDINDKEKNKKIKNKMAKRFIPLHTFLATVLNLPAYASHLKKNGHKRLFPELPYGRDGYGQAISRWFNGHGDGVTTGYKKSCGITDEKKVFHSFRHTIINHLKQKQVNYALLHEFDGHSFGTETYKRYGKEYNLPLVYDEIVSQITFDKELDLAHLTKSKYVFP